MELRRSREEPTTIARAGLLRRYTRWLHTRWPAGAIEKLPLVREDGSTNVPGLYIVGDLSGVPLLKFAADSGARAVRTIAADPAFRKLREDRQDSAVVDIAIIGGGVSGMAAALEARAGGLSFTVLEASEPFSTIVNFPRRKPIYVYPSNMTPAGELQLHANIKEDLVDELRTQTLNRGITPRIARAERVQRRGRWLEVVLAGQPSLLARRVIVAIGRSGNFRPLGVPGDDLDKVCNRLHDPKDFAGKNVLVVGGGDSALETAVAIAQFGGNVTLSYRGREFSRPKPENVERLNRLLADPMADVAIESPTSERVTTSSGPFMQQYRAPGAIHRMLGSRVKSIAPGDITLVDADGREQTIPNDAVFSMIGREAPLDFFRRSGVQIRGEWRTRDRALLALFALFCVFLYHWKTDVPELPLQRWFRESNWFPFDLGRADAAVGGALTIGAQTPGHVLHVMSRAMGDPSFYYTLAYCVCVVLFGVQRIRRRKTPYVRVQTLTLMAIQCLPLFILPQILLPWAGENGWFARGTWGGAIADQFFEAHDTAGLDRAYWRAYGFILAWPLFIWNVFTDQPMWGWLVVSFLQTFVLIPLMIYYWGKGAYCGWICSCGALAETLGDAHRHKMPHGPLWNRLNMLGQAILAAAFLLLLLRIIAWFRPGSPVDAIYHALLTGVPFLNYKWLVDVMLAGVVGVGCYFWLSGRVWCRFACPLAALMHIYARFSRFRILADKKKCISCNVCTAVCHQGIDVLNFANKGLPMEDPECVRCSACVQSCPTGVLEFGQIDGRSGAVRRRDRLPASLVQLTEMGRAQRGSA